jgi:hypothetical protein
MQAEADQRLGRSAPARREADDALAAWLMDMLVTAGRAAIDALRRVFGR